MAVTAISAATTLGVTKEQQMLERLDAFKASFTPAYVICGVKVRVPTAFRMNHGDSASYFRAIKAAVGDAAFSKIIGAADRVTAGRGTAEDVRVVTQALIDAGGLGDGYDWPADAVRAMQRKFGVGVDCAGYAQQAFLAARGLSPTNTTQRARYGFNASLANECLANLGSRGFQRMSPDAARAGDLFILDGEGGVGHCTIVRDRRVLDAATKQKWARESPRAAAFLGGDVHVFDIDASWGGGVGVRRHVWLYDAKTKTWAERENDGVYLSGARPYGHKIDGIFRPAGEL